MQSVIELEAGLIEKENEAKEVAEEKIRAATAAGKKLREDTLKKLPNIEAGERNKLTNEVDARTEQLRDDEDRSIRALERTIADNRSQALAYILNHVVPGWDGTIPE